MEESRILSEAKLQGLILAGGQSRRMGRDKAMIPYHGMPQYMYMAGLLEGLGISPFLSARQDQIDTWKPEIPCIADRFDDKGPLGGILSAQLAQPETAWLVVACDYAYLTDKSLRELIVARDVAANVTAFISPSDEGSEGLLGIWEPDVMSGLIKVIQQERLGVRSFLKTVRTSLIEANFPEELENVNWEKN